VVFATIIFGPAGETAAVEDGLLEQQTLTGDWGGMRTTLKDSDIDLNANDTSAMLSNPVGGLKHTAIHEGLLTSLNLDLEKLVNWPRATTYSEAYQINGRGLSRSAIGNLLVVSNIEALPGARLNDLWFQQELLDRQLSLRIGQIVIDDPEEFYYSQYSVIAFIDSTFGCPDILSRDLPSGGPCYPRCRGCGCVSGRRQT
jgi:porin